MDTYGPTDCLSTDTAQEAMRGQGESLQNGSESKEWESFGGERCDSVIGSEGVGDVAGESEEDEGVEGGEGEGCGHGLRSGVEWFS